MVTFTQLGRLGRLGNQLFQYSALRGLALSKGYVCKIPHPSLREWHGQKCLLEEFNIINDYLTQEDVRQLRFRFHEGDPMSYNEDFYRISDNTDISGFFQSIHYFKHHQEQIKRELTPKPHHLLKAHKEIDALKQRYGGHEIVSLHIRRGDNVDYTDPSQVELREFFNEGGSFDHYVSGALDIFKDKKVKFLVFSGGQRGTNDNAKDIAWCKQRLAGDEFIFSENHSVLEDFSLIMCCDHNILSHVSSFGWWAAYLNSNKEKIVVAPRNYHPDLPNLDFRAAFYPPEWRLI